MRAAEVANRMEDLFLTSEECIENLFERLGYGLCFNPSPDGSCQFSGST